MSSKQFNRISASATALSLALALFGVIVCQTACRPAASVGGAHAAEPGIGAGSHSANADDDRSDAAHSAMTRTTQVRAGERPDAKAVLGDLQPLLFVGGGDETADYAAQVRAGSALRRWGTGLVVVQDDVNVLALRDTAGAVTPLLLPRGKDDRRRFDDRIGNKQHKLDLESALVLPDGRLVALGSGSTRRRDRIAIAWPDGRVALRDGAALYERLRDTPDFAGPDLNIEGAVVVGDRLRLFQRGNGAPHGSQRVQSATADFALTDWVRWLDGDGALPPILGIVQYDLGSIDGVPLAFTDATALPSGALAFLACGERSADAVQDGEIVGCRVGLIEGGSAWTAAIRDPQGQPVRLKLEGIEPLAGAPAGRLRFAVVTDQDDADAAALIGTLDLTLQDGVGTLPAAPRSD